MNRRLASLMPPGYSEAKKCRVYVSPFWYCVSFLIRSPLVYFLCVKYFQLSWILMYHTTDIGVYFIANVLTLMQAWFHLLYDFTLMGSLLAHWALILLFHIYIAVFSAFWFIFLSSWQWVQNYCLLFVNFKSFLVHTLGLMILLLECQQGSLHRPKLYFSTNNKNKS